MGTLRETLVEKSLSHCAALIAPGVRMAQNWMTGVMMFLTALTLEIGIPKGSLVAWYSWRDGAEPS